LAVETHALWAWSCGLAMPVPYGLGRKARFENPPPTPFAKGGEKTDGRSEQGTGVI